MIICLGTTPAKQRTMTFSRLALDSVNRAVTVSESASGKVINVARVLHALEEDAIATGFVGGEAGAFLRRDLDAAGIRHRFLTVAAETRTCVTVIDQSAGTATELVEESHPVEEDAWQRLETALGELLAGADGLVMSGTLATGGPADFYARCTRLAAEAGVKCIVDASGAPLAMALAARPFIAKPNRAELARTLGIEITGDGQLRSAMRQVIGAGATWIVVTLGADGAAVTDGRRFWRISTPRIEVVSPIGSGDAFAAGLAAGTRRGQDVVDACRLATACAAANALTPMAGHVHPEDIHRLLEQVTVKSWD